MLTPDAHQHYQPDPDVLRGRVIAVTGAGSGVGRAVALAAAAHGAELILIGRTVSRLEEVHSLIAALQRCEASIAPLDLERAIARDYDELAAALQSRYGRPSLASSTDWCTPPRCWVIGLLWSNTTCRPGARCCT